MWKNLGPESELTPVKNERRTRFLAFVDYLGTRDLYADAATNAELIEDRRNELEHGVQIKLQPHIAAGEVEIGVFSDTVLIAGARFSDVALCSALLIDWVLGKNMHRRVTDEFRLLRGGLSKGIELRSSYLQPARGISIIPFYDGGLAYAYELEGIRRGSRLFLTTHVTDDDIGSLRPSLFEWAYLSGVGAPTGPIREVGWPALIYGKDPAALVSLLSQCFARWRQRVVSTPVGREEYRRTIYHFDETIKCMIRSLNALAAEEGGRHSIETCVRVILPSPEDSFEDCPINLIWGFWFQMTLVLCIAGLADKYGEELAFMKEELARRDYLEKFVAEADYPNYKPVKTLISSGLWRG